MSDKKVVPFFYMGGLDQKREYVRIPIPGDKTTIHDTPVTDVHRQRWPESYQAFKTGVVDTSAGTPLKDCEWMVIGRINQLNSFNIYTCEQLVGVPDGVIDSLGMGSRAENERMRLWLDRYNAKPTIEEVEQRLSALEARLEEIANRPDPFEELDGRVATLEGQIAFLSAKRKPGRPRKKEAEPETTEAERAA